MSFDRLLLIQSFPAASRLLGPDHILSKLQCDAAMMPWMLCIGPSALPPVCFEQSMDCMALLRFD